MPDISWLPEWSEADLRQAIRKAWPHLDGRQLRVIPKLGAPLGVFCRGTAHLGKNLIVKAAWSEEAARNLLSQAHLIDALKPLGLPLQYPVLVHGNPVLVIHRRLPGRELSYDRVASLSPATTRRVAQVMAAALGRLHEPDAIDLVRASGIKLPPDWHWVQARSSQLRENLFPRLDMKQVSNLAPRLRWVDAVLASAGRPVSFLHGDFHGWNLLFDAQFRLTGVLDFESASAGDPACDFRYLPSLGPDLVLMREVIDHYGDIDIERILAWHLLTDLGDALWRTEQGVHVEAGPITRRVDDLLARLRAAGV